MSQSLSLTQCFITFQRQPSTLWEPCEWNAALSCSNMSWSCRSRGRTFNGRMLLIVQSPSDIFWTLAITFKMFKTYWVYSSMTSIHISASQSVNVFCGHAKPHFAKLSNLLLHEIDYSAKFLTQAHLATAQIGFRGHLQAHTFLPCSIIFYHPLSFSITFYHDLYRFYRLLSHSMIFYHVLSFFKIMFYHPLSLSSTIIFIYQPLLDSIW